MKNAIILHGTAGNPESFWFSYVEKGLKNIGYNVWLPQLPNAEYPNLEDWLLFVLKNGMITQETILIGHSAGAQLVLSILENIDLKIKKAILVSGYAKPLPKNNTIEREADDFNWSKIINKAEGFFFINSDNDPWGYNDVQGRVMFDHLGGTLIIKHDGHMGSDTYNQPYKEFPLILQLI